MSTRVWNQEKRPHGKKRHSCVAASHEQSISTAGSNGTEVCNAAMESAGLQHMSNSWNQEKRPHGQKADVWVMRCSVKLAKLACFDSTPVPDAGVSALQPRG